VVFLKKKQTHKVPRRQSPSGNVKGKHQPLPRRCRKMSEVQLRISKEKLKLARLKQQEAKDRGLMSFRRKSI
jgi:hypothetical protein